MTVLLIRHAVAKSRSSWEDDDVLRPLTKRGREQATALVDALRDYQIGRVLSSPSLRCIETIQPLADARRREIDIDQRVAEGSGRGAVKLVSDLLDEADNVALCSHGDVIPEVLGAFGLPWHRCAKGSTWVLDRDDATYIPPPV